MAARRRCLFKVIVLGDSGVGKTSLLNQHLTSCNLCPTLLETLSLGFVANFMTKELQVDDRLVTLQIWDTAGQERFQSLGVAFYRGADCCVLVYDVNMLKSFEDLDNWYLEFLNQASPADPDHFPFFLVGNKIDVDGGNSRVVSEKKADQWCASKGIMHYFETSAKEDLNIDATFLAIAKNSVKNHSEVAQSIYISGVEAAPEAEQPRNFCGC